MLFPDYFDKYKEVIPEAERGDMMASYYKRLTGDDEEEKLRWYVQPISHCCDWGLMRKVRGPGQHGKPQPASSS